MSKFQSLTYEEMQNSNGGSNILGKIVSRFLGFPGTVAYEYLRYLMNHPKEAKKLADDYYKECSRPNYNTD